MGKAARLNNQLRAKGFKKDIDISFGEMVSGASINKPDIARVIEFSASKDEQTIKGYIVPSLVNNKVKVQWFVTDVGGTSMNKARVLLQECTKYNNAVGKKVKKELSKADVVIYV